MTYGTGEKELPRRADADYHGAYQKLLPVFPPAATTVDRVIETVPEVVDKVTGFIEKQQEKKAQKAAEGDFAE